MNADCILAGVGGQGTVLASKLIAQAAMDCGLEVRTAETIGMAQRGGSVVSHVRIGTNIHSPLIPKHGADLIIGFEPGEAARSISYLKDDGTVITSSKAIMPFTVSIGAHPYITEDIIDYLKKSTGRTIVIDSDAICSECGSAKILNIALLGAAAAAGALPVKLEQLQEAITAKIPPAYVEMNIKALRLGAQQAIRP